MTTFQDVVSPSKEVDFLVWEILILLVEDAGSFSTETVLNGSDVQIVFFLVAHFFTTVGEEVLTSLFVSEIIGERHVDVVYMAFTNDGLFVQAAILAIQEVSLTKQALFL